MYEYDPVRYRRRISWFQKARFGLFLHFGLYAVPARGEWVRSYERMSVEDYQPYFEQFCPDRLDVRAWARSAREAGAQYVVLTAKHHDGFCLFDTAYTDYKITNTPFRRDLVGEYVTALREEGLKVGLYYSLLDWHHPDYPHCGDRYHPLRDDPNEGNEGRCWARYVDYLHSQVRELCTNYGKIDLLWFDFSYDKLRGEAWKGTQLADMVRTLQPDILLNNRLEVSGEGFGSLAQGHPTAYHGDFITPEQIIPPTGLQDPQGEDLCWESCITMNRSWGCCREDRLYKPARLLLRKLVECVSKGGNLILNVGPNARGEFPPESVAILREMGAWMDRNGESIYGCGKSSLPKPEWGRLTQKGNHLYLHVLEHPLGPLPVYGVSPDQFLSARLLSDGSEVPVSHSWVHSDYPDLLFLDLGERPSLPDETDTVIDLLFR